MSTDPSANPSVTMSVDAALKQAMAHQTAGRLLQAQQIYQGILQAIPDQPHALYWLATIDMRLSRFAQAEPRLRAILRRLPNNVDALTNLSIVLYELGRSVEAEQAARHAIKVDAGYALPYRSLARTLLHSSRHAEAAQSYRRALALSPEDATLMSELLYCMTQDEAVDAPTLAQAHRAFGKKFGAGLRDRAQSHANSRDPDKRLRVGFVSGDLRRHAVAYFIEPVWRELDREKVELFAYANLPQEDATSQRLKQLVDHWCPVLSLDDAQLAQRIRDDGIDILIDLSGHTVLNRLLAFARKPAPVQASWIGYTETTGLTAMDYALTNTFMAPPGAIDALYVEKLVRLDAGSAFQPDPASPELNALPALQQGHVTFGSFNRLSKLGAEVVPTWARVLQALPGSRLLIANLADMAQQERLRVQFAALGVASERLDFRPRLPMADYLRLHHEVDILLDTFPFSGGTTTQHALWMGVPTVTLAGLRRSERISTSNLARVGLQDWSAGTIEAYVDRAVVAAGDLAGLAELRAGLRQRIASSPMQHASTVARSLECAWRLMWRRWCDGLPPEAFAVSLEQALGKAAAAGQGGGA